MDCDYDDEDHGFRPGDACTASEFCNSTGYHRSVVNRWRKDGYLDKDGNRVYVKVRGYAYVNGRRVPVYLRSELASAELATRDKGGHNRKDDILAWSQQEMRAERAARRTAA